MGILLIIDGTVIRLTVERLLGGAEAIPSMPYHHPQPQQDGSPCSVPMPANTSTT
jgi:hypothetical protein